LEPREDSLATNRLRILARCCLGWGVIVALRLLELQVLDHEKYREQAHQQHESEVEVRAPRGSIFDRNGQALAMSAPVDSVFINPLRLSDPVVAADLLSKVLDIDQPTLQSRIASAIDSRRGFLWVKRKISAEEAAKLRSFHLDWIEFRAESGRYYPKGPVLAHVLGGVDHEEKGNAGIEFSLEKELRGKSGIKVTKKDVRQTIYEQQVQANAEPGKNVTLTIDERIQFVAERELAAAVKEHHAKTGSLVVMDPRSGQILAMANYPTYNPTVPPKPDDKTDNRRNLAIIAPFEPGSVFKVVTVAAALESTRLTPKSLFHCGNGSMTLFRRVIHDAKPHGMLSVADVLAKSSNIGAIKIGLEVGNERMYEYIRKFGFSQRTGIPLPSESPGLLRKLNRWIPSSIGSIAMGHEISTTTLQLARACSVVANGGFLVKPVLVLKKQRPSEAVETEPQEKPVQILRPQNAIKLRLMMERVVVKGTGTRAQLDCYTAAGKTGSAQIYDYDAKVYTHRYNGSFMGFAPVGDPRVVVVITLNGTPTGNRGFGGYVAAPVFRAVASAALRLMDVPRDALEPETPRDDSEPAPDLAVAGLSQPPEREELAQGVDQGVVPGVMTGPEPPLETAASETPAGPKVPNFQGKTKRAVLQESLALGVRVEIAGSGIARYQDPPAGGSLRPGEPVKVHFAP
jgi:cell division protein FtsI (penicillin-binding protein 3)